MKKEYGQSTYSAAEALMELAVKVKESGRVPSLATFDGTNVGINWYQCSIETYPVENED